MKKLILISSILCLGTAFSQTTLIPDSNFEQKLINLGFDTGVPDGGVPTANINTVSILNVNNAGIMDLTGIADFSALTTLYCVGNQLTSLDLSGNTALNSLTCSSNQLSSLNLLNNPNLFYLAGRDNALTSVNLSNNLALTTIDLSENQLTTLDLSLNVNLISVNLSQNNLTSITVSQCNNLSTFRCEQNNITQLDLSQNALLMNLYCGFNLLTSLDLSQNSVLNYLNCANNQLSCLNLKNGNNENLNFIYASSNPDLTCITVDNEIVSTSSWQGAVFVFDPQTLFSNSCANPCALSISELNAAKDKKLIHIFDIMGQEISFQPNTLMIYVYDDGSSERVMEVE